MNIPISDEHLHSIVSAAVLNAISTEARDTILQAAIKHLMTPGSSMYGGTKATPLQEAFNASRRGAYCYCS